MRLIPTVLSAGLALAMLAGCKQEPTPVPEAAPTTAAVPAPEPAPGSTAEVVTTPAASATAAPVAAFDANAIPLSTTPLGEWPYVAAPAGYEFESASSKDLARVPLWTGSELVWVEGRTFEADIDDADGKTYSRFELLKGIEQSLEALGAVKLSGRSYGEAFYREHEAELESFRSEFDDIRSAYWYDTDASTWVIRRDASLSGVVLQSGTDDGAIMVAEGPLPAAATN